jgi:hypothetical protein
MERSPAATTSTLGTTAQRVVGDANAARSTGDEGWWRPLEAALAALGSQAEGVVECVNDEAEAGKPKPVDVEYLLANVVPSLLRLSGGWPRFLAWIPQRLISL